MSRQRNLLIFHLSIRFRSELPKSLQVFSKTNPKCHTLYYITKEEFFFHSPLTYLAFPIITDKSWPGTHIWYCKFIVFEIWCKFFSPSKRDPDGLYLRMGRSFPHHPALTNQYVTALQDAVMWQTPWLIVSFLILTSSCHCVFCFLDTFNKTFFHSSVLQIHQ